MVRNPPILNLVSSLVSFLVQNPPILNLVSSLVFSLSPDFSCPAYVVPPVRPPLHTFPGLPTYRHGGGAMESSPLLLSLRLGGLEYHSHVAYLAKSGIVLVTPPKRDIISFTC